MLLGRGLRAGGVFQREEGQSVGHTWTNVIMHDPGVSAHMAGRGAERAPMERWGRDWVEAREPVSWTERSF